MIFVSCQISEHNRRAKTIVVRLMINRRRRKKNDSIRLCEHILMKRHDINVEKVNDFIWLFLSAIRIALMHWISVMFGIIWCALLPLRLPMDLALCNFKPKITYRWCCGFWTEYYQLNSIQYFSPLSRHLESPRFPTIVDIRVYGNNEYLNGSLHILFRNVRCTVYIKHIYRNKTKLMSNNYSRSNHYHWTHITFIQCVFLPCFYSFSFGHFFNTPFAIAFDRCICIYCASSMFVVMCNGFLHSWIVPHPIVFTQFN